MTAFFIGHSSVPLGRTLIADINTSLLSDKQDMLPPSELATRLKEAGYEHMVSIIPDHLSTPDLTALTKSMASFPIRTAKVYSIERDFQNMIAAGNLLTLAKNYLLIEGNKTALSSQLEDAVFTLQLKGYHPVLMQAERYEYLQDNYRNIKRLGERGCLFHTDILSLTGYHGNAAKRLAGKLIEDGLASFVGSGVSTQEEHQKFVALQHSKRLNKLLSAEHIKNKELV